MVLSTFDKELYEKDLKDEAFEEGAYQKLKSLIKKKIYNICGSKNGENSCTYHQLHSNSVDETTSERIK